MSPQQGISSPYWKWPIIHCYVSYCYRWRIWQSLHSTGRWPVSSSAGCRSQGFAWWSSRPKRRPGTIVSWNCWIFSHSTGFFGGIFTFATSIGCQRPWKGCSYHSNVEMKYDAAITVSIYVETFQSSKLFFVQLSQRNGATKKKKKIRVRRSLLLRFYTGWASPNAIVSSSHWSFNHKHRIFSGGMEANYFLVIL